MESEPIECDEILLWYQSLGSPTSRVQILLKLKAISPILNCPLDRLPSQRAQDKFEPVTNFPNIPEQAGLGIWARGNHILSIEIPPRSRMEAYTSSQLRFMEFATMPSTSTALAGGSRLAKFAPWITTSRSFRNMVTRNVLELYYWPSQSPTVLFDRYKPPKYITLLLFFVLSTIASIDDVEAFKHMMFTFQY
ncbi:hypothetical protein ACS0TY_033857 [Phlomoides rotata]